MFAILCVTLPTRILPLVTLSEVQGSQECGNDDGQRPSGLQHLRERHGGGFDTLEGRGGGDRSGRRNPASRHNRRSTRKPSGTSSQRSTGEGLPCNYHLFLRSLIKP